MNIEEIKAKYFFTEFDYDSFLKDISSLDIIDLKKMSVHLNNLAEEKRKKLNDNLSETAKRYLSYIESFKDEDYALIFDKLDSIKYGKPCAININSSMFSVKAIEMISIIDTMDERVLEEFKCILYYSYRCYVQDKELSKIYTNTILK